MIKGGIIIADGKPKEILTSENISNLYDYNLKIQQINGCWKIFPCYQTMETKATTKEI